MNEIMIETGIPIPVKSSKLKKYPFENMKVGDSLFATGKDGYKLRIAAYSWQLRHINFKVISRSIDGGIRIWRVPVE